MFSDKTKIFVDKENKKVRLSIKQSEEVVMVYIFDLSEFQAIVNQFNAQL
jgi:hypothetical protein